MQKLRKFVQQKWYVLFFIVVLIIAVFMRFYNYSSRWGLGYDQAHDAIIAHYAVSHLQIPLLGPFSSAGPYQTGGEWYWLLMIGTYLFPTYINGPWIFMTLFQTFFVVALILIGKELVNKKFGLIAGILAAVSPSQVSQSVNLTCTGPIALFALATIWAMMRFVRTKKSLYVFLLGLFVGTAISIHTQGATLLLVIVLTAFFVRFSIKQYGLLLFGLLLPFVPIFIAESSHGFFNTKGALQYYLHDQYKITLEMLGRRWLTYIGILWPNAIANITGGPNILGYIGLLMTFVAMAMLWIKRQFSKEWIILSLSFIGFIVGLRYVHAPLFDSYFMFVNPFVFFFIALCLSMLFQSAKLKFIAIIVLLLFVFGSLYRDNQAMAKGTNNAVVLLRWERSFLENYPGKKIDLYDYRLKNSSLSFPFLYFIQFNHNVGRNGYRIAFGTPAKENTIKHQRFPLMKGSAGFTIFDAESSTSAQLQKAGWARITPRLVYNSTELWYVKKK